MRRYLLPAVIAVCFLLAGCVKSGTSQPVRPSSPASASGATSMKSAAPAPSDGSPSAKLKSVLAKYTSEQISFFESFALDGGKSAAFAVAGNEVWYVTFGGAGKLKSGIGFLQGDKNAAPVLWNVGGTKIFKCEDVGGSSSISCAWYVKDGKPVELPHTGMYLTYLGGGKFTTIGDTFDAVLTDGQKAGHTYKLYYLYWSPEGLKEYGGLKITQGQLLKAKGAKAVIDAIVNSGHTVDDIFYRADNIINVNYHNGDSQNGSFDNVTLEYKENSVTPKPIADGSDKSGSFSGSTLSDFSYGGTYQKALFPDIATYPAAFPAK